MERQSTVRDVFQLAFVGAVALAGCGSAQAPDAATEGELTDVGAPSASASSTWRNRFKRQPGTSPRNPSMSTMGPFATDERQASAEEKRRAKDLYSEGLKLMDAERYEEACPKFLAAHDLVRGGVPLLRLSQCLEYTGDIPGACEAARASIVLLERNGSSGSSASRVQEANNRIEALKCL